MTQQELETAYNVFAKLAEELRAVAEGEGGEPLQRVLAGTGYVLSNMGEMVAEIKGRVEDVAYRERTREREPDSLRDERAIRYFAAELKPDDRERLVKAVEAGPPNISVRIMAQDIAGRLGMQPWSVTEVLESVASFYNFLAQRETEEDVNRVAAYLTDRYDAEVSTKEVLRSVDAANPASVFTQQLKRLLRCHSTLGVTHKADALLRRNERQYKFGTVSTDLRPIFSGNVDAAPSYGVIMHNFMLNLTEGITSRSICIALTSADILNLIEALSRAHKKEQTLRRHAPYKILPMG